MLVLAAVLAVTVGALWGVIAALVGVSDLGLAALIRAGVLGDAFGGGGGGGDDGSDAADYGTLGDGRAVREGENPLARED